jgi:hypothetical protein
MTDIIQSTYQMEVEWHMIQSTSLPSDMLTVSYISFHFHLIYWVYHICHSTSIWYVECIISVIPLPSDMIHSTYQIEVETSTWYVDCIICHSTSIWYVDCIISVILLPCDMLTVSYLSFHFYLICWLYHIGMTDMIQSTYQMEVEWQIWYSQHIR